MLNKLPQIIVVILSIFLAFYCVDFHKETILSVLSVEENTTTTQTILDNDSIKNIVVETEVVEVVDEENQSLKDSENNTAKESTYIESLAVDSEKDNTIEEVEVIPTEVLSTEESLVEEKPIVMEEEKIEVKEIHQPVVVEKIEVIEEVIETKTEEHQPISESTKGYALDDLEKMILEELKNGEDK